MMRAHACFALSRIIQSLLDKLSPPALDHVLSLEQINSTERSLSTREKASAFLSNRSASDGPDQSPRLIPHL